MFCGWPGLWVLLVGLCLGACASDARDDVAEVRAPGVGAAGDEAAHARARASMVKSQIAARGVKDARVLDAMRRVPRHRFVPARLADSAYDDTPLPIGFGQTISQPFIVGYMTEVVRVEPQDRVLEVGTGSGYQAAVLAEIAREVYTVEIVPELAVQAEGVLRALKYRNIHVRQGDGYGGWPEYAPFDAIVVTAAPDHVPRPLIEQLAAGGRLVIPVGSVFQEMKVITKGPGGVTEESTIPVRFVPLVRTKPRSRGATERNRPRRRRGPERYRT
jgi:protein-L-isoaspartate(D-aspartate) O-methyltransferase